MDVLALFKKFTKKGVFEGLMILSSIGRSCNVMQCIYVDNLYFLRICCKKNETNQGSG